MVALGSWRQWCSEILELSLTYGFTAKYCPVVAVESLFCLCNEGQGSISHLISASMALSHQESCERTAAQQNFQCFEATVLSAAIILFS